MTNNKVALSPAFERNNIPIALAVNNFYAPYAGVFIQSLLDHTSEGQNYDIIIFQRDISEENQRLLKSLAVGYTNVSIRFYDPSSFLAQFHFNYDQNAHLWPLEVFYKLIAPHILKYSGRMITVDTDTLLRADIARLINEDLDGYCVGGVCDLPVIGMYSCNYTSFSKNTNIREYFRNVRGFGLEDLKSYVNGGLLLYDCDKYVQELDVEAILNMAQHGRYLYPQQDTLNVLMKGKIKCLDFAWNVIARSSSHHIRFIDAGSKIFDGACERAYEDPYLIHWAGKPRPWVCPDVSWGSEWWQTALRTPFVGHIIARMMNELTKRQQYYRDRYGKENVDVWDPTPKGILRTENWAE